MTVFICHSSRDHAAVRLLVEHLQAARESVWLDQSLIGGEAWWERILHQIRSCSVFMVALSNNTLQSKPCRAEMGYAKSLGLPVLPVVIGDVDSYRIDPIFTIQSVDLRNATTTSGAALVTAVREKAAERKELPDPLPEPPPIPYEYLQRLGVAIDSPDELSPTEQATILTDLRQALRREDDESVRQDIRRLLSALRRRSEVTHGNVEEIDDLLRRNPAAGDSAAPPEQKSEAAQAAKVSTPEAGSPAISVEELARNGANAEPTKRPVRMMPKTIAIAGAAIVVVAIVAIVAFLLIGRTSSGSANKSAPATTQPSTPSALVEVAALEGLLLSPAEINRVLGATTMTVISPPGTWAKMIDNAPVVAEENCRASNDTTEISAYAGSGWSTLRGQSLRDAESITKFATQAVVLFPSVDQAAAFLPTAQQRWQACSGHSYTYDSPQGRGIWDAGPATVTNGTLHSTSTEENRNGWACQHALTVTNNVAIDVAVCSYNPGDGAVNIAHQIAAKVAQQ